MEKFKSYAESQGYKVWFDSYLKLWTFIKDGSETEYFTRHVLEAMGIEKFKQILGDWYDRILPEIL